MRAFLAMRAESKNSKKNSILLASPFLNEYVSNIISHHGMLCNPSTYLTTNLMNCHETIVQRMSKA